MAGEGRAEIDAAVNRYLHALGAAIAADAAAGCPKDSGELAESIGYEVQGRTVRVGSDLRYAAAVEFGSRGHVIFGRPMLRFFWERAGAWVSFRRVNHPGTPAQPYLRPALFRQRGNIL